MWGVGFLSSPLGLTALVVVVGVLVYVAFTQRKQRRQKQREAQEVLEDVEGSERWRGKRVCVVVNPYGGQGEGERIFKEIVSPMFKRAGLQIDKLGKSSALVSPLTFYPFRKIETTHQGHAKKMMATLDVHKYDAVVSVSGDVSFLEDFISI